MIWQQHLQDGGSGKHILKQYSVAKTQQEYPWRIRHGDPWLKWLKIMVFCRNGASFSSCFLLINEFKWFRAYPYAHVSSQMWLKIFLFVFWFISILATNFNDRVQHHDGLSSSALRLGWLNRSLGLRPVLSWIDLGLYVYYPTCAWNVLILSFLASETCSLCIQVISRRGKDFSGKGVPTALSPPCAAQSCTSKCHKAKHRI